MKLLYRRKLLYHRGACWVQFPKPGNTIYYYIHVFFLRIDGFFSSGRGSFLVLSAPGHVGSPPEHHGASVGRDRGPRHVLWMFKIAMSDGLHLSFRILLTARTDCLPNSCSCSSGRIRARVHLVLMLGCSCSCSSARSARSCDCLHNFRLAPHCHL